MPDDDQPMTQEAAKEFQNSLSRLAKTHVEQAYREAFLDCALIAGKPPSPFTIQRLLCVWKVLWKWRDQR